MWKLKLFILVLLVLNPFVIAFSAVQLHANHPVRYQVKPGDTLWSIAAKFLKNPRQWREVWEENPDINSPKKLFPGDIVELHLVNGNPRVHLVGNGTITLRPEPIVSAIKDKIPSIPYEDVRSFLYKDRVFEVPHLKTAPYVVALGEEHASGGDTDIYVRGIFNPAETAYIVYHVDKPYIEPLTHEILGYPATYVSRATLLQSGDPSVLNIHDEAIEVEVGDRLSLDDETQKIGPFYLREPAVPVKGEVISVLGEPNTVLTRYDSLVIDRGRCEGLHVGDILFIYKRGKVIVDTVLAEKNKEDQQNKKLDVRLPSRYAGKAMVYKVFDRVSYVLILEATKTIHLLDLVESPNGKV